MNENFKLNGKRMLFYFILDAKKERRMMQTGKRKSDINLHTSQCKASGVLMALHCMGLIGYSYFERAYRLIWSF